MCRLLTTVIFHIKGLLLLFINLLLLFTIIIIGISIIIVYGVAQKVENTIWLSTWRFGSLHIYAVVVICNSRLQIIMTNTLNMLPETVDNFAWPVNCEAVVVIVQIVQDSPFLTMDLLESCFPYALLRTSYHHVYRHAEALWRGELTMTLL